MAQRRTGKTDCPYVSVWWVDAYADSEEFPVAEILAPDPDSYLIETTGVEVRRDDVWVIIAHEITQDGASVRGYTAIPAPLVVRRTVLKGSPTRRT